MSILLVANRFYPYTFRGSPFIWAPFFMSASSLLEASVCVSLQGNGWKLFSHIALALILNPSPLGRRTLIRLPFSLREQGVGG